MRTYRGTFFRRRNYKQKLALYIIIGLIGLTVFGVVAAFGVFAWFARDLPSPSKLSATLGYSTVFYDRNDKVLYEIYKDKNRVPADFKNISTHIKQATIAIEDKEFYKHRGISERGLIRAAFNIARGESLQSGSTITQQLIKNVLLTSQQTASRKIQEMILAIEVERKYNKDEILQMYLNEAPYGGSFWGVASASKGYFNKSPKDVTLAEAAFLAGLPQSPSYYSPFIGKNDTWKGRSRDVLRRMREDGYITSKQEKDAFKQIQNMKFTEPNISINAPHFVFYAREQLEKEFGPRILDQGLKVKTTIDLDVQQAAEKIVKDEIENLKNSQVGNGAAVVMDSQTGEILAMVGSYDYNNPDYGKFNAATGKRQPGSSIKPLTFAVALEKGYTPATVLMDLRTVFPVKGSRDYVPVNYDGKYRGPSQMRFALGNSLNIPAVKMIAMIGVKDFLTKADEMGLNSFAPTQANMERFGLAITLGGGESTLVDMTSMYTIFARGGTRKGTQSLLEVSDAKGKVIYKKKDSTEKRVLSPETSFLISHMLSDNVARTDAFGSNSLLNIPGKTVAVKTGTTDEKRDNYAIGYTNDVTVGVWVGNNDNTPMNPRIASGITGASPIWNKIMKELLQKYKDGIMDKPDRVKAIEIDSYLGGLPKDGYPKRSEYFTEGTEPKDQSPFYKRIRVSKSTGKLANDVEIRSGNYEEKEYIVITENDPVSFDGKNRWQEAIDEWARSQSDDKFKPPTEKSDGSSEDLVISIRKPGDRSTVDSNNVEINAKIASLTSIKEVKLLVNNNEVKAWNGDTREINETINLSDGVYEIKVYAKNEKDKVADSVIKIGVKRPWDASTPPPSATPVVVNNDEKDQKRPE